jgi:predicted transcriptional regulator
MDTIAVNNQWIYFFDMTRRDPMIHVRVPDELKDKLGSLAKGSGRSMNAEIVHRLEESVYLSRSAMALAEGELNDAERTLVALWRRMNDEQRRSWILLLKSGLNSGAA